MRPRVVGAILRKEIVETLRDRRTLLMMVGLPVLLYPLMIIGISKLQESQAEAREERVSEVAVWGLAPRGLIERLRSEESLRVAAWTAAPADIRMHLERGSLAIPDAVIRDGEDDEPASGQRASAEDADPQPPEPDDPVSGAAREALLRRKPDTILVLWPGAGRALAEGRLAYASVYFDSVNPNSTLARRRLARVLEQYRKDVIAARQRERGLDEGFATALRTTSRNVAPRQRRSGQALGTFLPFLLIVMSLLGGFYPAIDMTAGEKERGTMQTLLCAPISSSEIITGKFLAVWGIALIAALANVLSLAATIARIIPGRMTVDSSAYVLTFVMLVPVTFTITAAFLAVAAFAKDFKDGQNFLTPVYMVLALPAGITMLPGIELNAWTAFVPVVNIALLIKGLLLGDVSLESAFLTAVSSLMYGALTVLFAARVFEREQVLLGGREPLASLFGLHRRKGGVPSPTLASVTFGVSLVLAFYGSLALDGAGTIVQLLTLQLLFFLAPLLAVVVGLGFSPRETLGLRRPPLAGVVAAVLIGATAWTFAAGVVMRLFPPPARFVEALERALLFKDQPVPIWAILVVIGVLPGVCEELFFRGMLFSAYRRFGVASAVAASALLFGVAHASIYRLLPTMFMGALFAVVMWRTGSVFCGMIAHALNNGLIALMVQHEPLATAIGIGSSGAPPLKVTLGGTAVTAAGLAILLLARGPQTRLPAGEGAGGASRAG